MEINKGEVWGYRFERTVGRFCLDDDDALL